MKQTNRIKYFETHQSGINGNYYFNARGHNGRVIFQSEGYTTKRKRDNTVELINSSLVTRVRVKARPVAQPSALKPARALVNQTKVARKVGAKKAPAKKKV